MTLIETKPTAPVPADQMYEIRTMAESGQFADALIRLRKIKPLYPRNTFLVALEKQLERLLVLPRDAEPSGTQKKDLLSSLPGLVQGAVDSLRQQSPAQVRPAAPPPKTERSDRDAARSQLKEQYFQHADEYLKKGAYGSALVEIRRVKIIAPDDPTVTEYERTIRQLVELQQRTGVTTHDADTPAALETDSPRTGVEASPTPAPPVREYDSVIMPLASPAGGSDTEPSAPLRRKSRAVPNVVLIILVICIAVAALAIFSNPDQTEPTSGNDQTTGKDQSPVAQVQSPVTQVQPPVTQIHQPPAEATTDPAARTVMAITETAAPSDATPAKTEKPAVTEPATHKADNTQPPPPATLHRHTSPAAVVQNTEPKANPEESVPLTPAKPVYADSDPQIEHLEQPVLPHESSGSTGTVEVIIMVQVNQEGKPVKTMVAKSTNAEYNAPIVSAVMRSTYKPGTTPAGPATKWITIPFRIQ